MIAPTVLPSRRSLTFQGKSENIDSLFMRVLEILRVTVGEGHPHYSIVLNKRAGMLIDQVRFAATLRSFHRIQFYR